MIAERLEALILARASTLRGPASARELLGPLARYSPSELTPAAWQAELLRVSEALQPRVLHPDHQLGDRGELHRRLGEAPGSWPQLADRVLPGLGLGIAPSDSKTLHKLSSRDAWAAAILARVRGIWREGPPPSLASVCDAIAWERLGLAGKPKRLPAEVRSLFLRQDLDAASGPPDRLVRQLAAKELGVPRADARALRDGLVRGWLSGRELGPVAFVDEVRATARTLRDGAFGERKVFISSVWDHMRRHGPWSALTLDEFKARLLAAHRAGELVLARADLVAAMPAALVAASETGTDGASFHFILRDPA